MPKISLRFLNRSEVEALAPEPCELVRVVNDGLIAHGRGEVVLPPKAHLLLDHLFNGHFNILPGYVAPVGRAGVKVVGDYVDNWQRGLPSEIALLTLYEPATGVPVCIMDATSLTWMRTGAVTCAGAVALARPRSRIVTHLGARGSAFSNIRLLTAHFPLQEVRILSARPETRERLAARVRGELGVEAVAMEDAAAACEGADIVVEATRLEQPATLIPESALAPGALLVTYGWVRAIDPALPRGVEKFVVDDWEQCTKGGQLHELIARGELTRADLYAEIGEIVAGKKPGRETAAERIVFWHRGFAISDIMLGDWIFRRAEMSQTGVMLDLLEAGEE